MVTCNVQSKVDDDERYPYSGSYLVFRINGLAVPMVFSDLVMMVRLRVGVRMMISNLEWLENPAFRFPASSDP